MKAKQTNNESDQEPNSFSSKSSQNELWNLRSMSKTPKRVQNRMTRNASNHS